MTTPERPVGEVAWMRDWLCRLQKRAPTREWQWGAAKSTWDSTEILRMMRLEATIDGPVIWRAISSYEAEGRWPRISGRAAYFLRERLLAAVVAVDAWMQECHPSSSGEPPVRPSDAEALARRLLIEHWDKTGVEQWLEENKDTFQELDWD